MTKAKDIKFNLDDDIAYLDGDFLVSESDQDHVVSILESYVGHWKEFPLLGVGVERYNKSSGRLIDLKREIKIHMQSDGYRVGQIIISEGKYYIDAERI